MSFVVSVRNGQFWERYDIWEIVAAVSLNIQTQIDLMEMDWAYQQNFISD